MLSSIRSRIRNSRRSNGPSRVGLSTRPLPLLIVVLAFFLVFQNAKCFASAAGTKASDRISSTDANLATDAPDTARPDAAARLAATDDEAKAEPSDDVPAALVSSAPAVADLSGTIVNPETNTIGSAHSRTCVLFRESLCRAAENRPLLSLAAVQTAALISDGVTTRQYLRRGYVEVDPVARILIGRKPTWGRMLPLGAVQVFAGAWLGEEMAMSRHLWVRRFWWLPQAIGIAANAAASAHNVALH
jgi:hypothetical protein